MTILVLTDTSTPVPLPYSTTYQGVPIRIINVSEPGDVIYLEDGRPTPQWQCAASHFGMEIIDESEFMARVHKESVE